MTVDVSPAAEIPVTPGLMLRATRVMRGLTEGEVAQRLNIVPGYVAVLERDDYRALRSPAFARGYVKAYGRLLGMDEAQLLGAFDALRSRTQEAAARRVDTRPVQLQRTGAGLVVGVLVSLALVAALWWWHGGGGTDAPLVPVQPQLHSPAGEGAAGARQPAGVQ
jgi:cytoskeletal protein RodZ